MPTATAHYANLLARHYTWMLNLSFDEKVTEQRTILSPILKDTPRGPAVDLGAGPGFQSLALAQLGFSPILALDTSPELLTELESALLTHTTSDNIHTHQADILNLANHVQPATAAAIVCMGDTLTHLPDHESVRHLFSAAATALAPGGLFVLTWRDLTIELKDTDRFIPVRSDSDKIMTCFLEYTSPTTVQVHDLVYTRDPNHDPAKWTVEKSSFPKLRLSPAWVTQELTAAGLAAQSTATAGRLSLTVAQKPL
jgi:SAM-dependent methyltransferase